MPSNRRILHTVAGVAVLLALGSGAAYLATDSIIALRVLWLAGPVALTSVCFVLLQAWLPKD